VRDSEQEMSEHSHSGAVRFQSMALVMAALITTAGAVTSAFIQAGWIGRTSAVSASVSPPVASRPQAFFAGTIETPRSSSFVAEEPLVEIKPAVEPVTLQALVEQSAAPIGAGRASASPVGHDSHAEAKPAAKLLDWGVIPRLFQSKN
jgi:hypothetical protein